MPRHDGGAKRPRSRPAPIAVHDAALQAARRRMLDADDAKYDGARDAWEAWQQAATEYWLIKHPELARYRRGDPNRVPSVAEFQDRAGVVAGALDGIPSTWRLAPASEAKVEHLARVGWWHELLAGLYEPVWSAATRTADDAAALEILVRFLEADVYCFRSGYEKAHAVRAVMRAEPDVPTLERLRAVLLSVVDGYDRREFRSYLRIARRLNDEALRRALGDRLTSQSLRTRRHARWVLDALVPPRTT